MKRSLGWMLVAAGLMLTAGAVQAQPSGEELYLHHCGVCHQPDGKGIPGFFPPLAARPICGEKNLLHR